MFALIDLTGRHRGTGSERVFRYCDGSGGYNTKPSDDVPNVHYAPRINQAGNFRRSLFGGQGRTNGIAEVDRGETLLNNMDGKLDELLEYAFDGLDMRIWLLPKQSAPYSARRLAFRGTVEQAEIVWEEVKLRVRSRLAILDVPIQPVTLKGTTIAGGMIEAEGDENLKGAPRPLLFGGPVHVAPVLLNRFDLVYAVGQRASAILKVRDSGSVLTAAGQDYPTLAALLAAAIPPGRYATCLALGLFRLQSKPQGLVTAEVQEGATEAARTAGQVARRILVEQAGLVPDVDFLDSDIVALDAAVSAPVGIWTGTNATTTLSTLSFVLDSVGAFIAPDRLGVFRIGRWTAPETAPVRTFSEIEIIEADGTGIQKLATGDEGRGVPAKKITVQHSRNYAVMSEDALSGEAKEEDETFVAFVKEEWRQEIEESAGVAALHKLATEMVFQTALVRTADAKVETVRRMAQYGAHRDRFDVPIRSQFVGEIDLASIMGLRLRRFGLGAGKSFTVSGVVEDFESNITTLDVWG